MTFFGNNDVGVYGVSFITAVGDIVLNNIFLNGVTLVSGKTMFLINIGQSVADLTSGVGNLNCPEQEILEPGEGVILEYFVNAWYCMEHKRLV